MKNLLIGLLAITMISSSMFAQNNEESRINRTENSIRVQERVDSFEVVETDNNEKRGCSISINYYYQGQFVGQQTYGGDICPILGVKTCSDWRNVMINHIQGWVDSEGTMMPAGNDYTC